MGSQENMGMKREKTNREKKKGANRVLIPA